MSPLNWKADVATAQKPPALKKKPRYEGVRGLSGSRDPLEPFGGGMAHDISLYRKFAWVLSALGVTTKGISPLTPGERYKLLLKVMLRLQ